MANSIALISMTRGPVSADVDLKTDSSDKRSLHKCQRSQLKFPFKKRKLFYLNCGLNSDGEISGDSSGLFWIIDLFSLYMHLSFVYGITMALGIYIFVHVSLAADRKVPSLVGQHSSYQPANPDGKGASDGIAFNAVVVFKNLTITKLCDSFTQ